MLRIFILLASAAVGLGFAQDSCQVTTVAGGGLVPGGEAGPALEAELRRPMEVRRGPDGLVYFADVGHHRIRRITDEGLLETVVGTGHIEPAGDGLPGLEASIGEVLAMDFAPDGTLVWLEQNRAGTHYRIRRLSADGLVESVAGAETMDSSGDGGPAAEAGLFGSIDIAVGPDSSIYIAARRIHRIRKIGPDGVIDTIAGSGDPRQAFPPPESAGDGGPAIEAVIPNPQEIVVAPDSTLYVRELGNRIRRIRPDGSIDTYLELDPAAGDVPDGASRADQPFYPAASPLAVDALGRLYFIGMESIRRIGLDDRFETVGVRLSPFFLDAGAEDSIFTAFSNQIYSVTADADYTHIAGIQGRAYSAGDGGPPEEAILAPEYVATGPAGETYFYDQVSLRIRVVRDGVVESFAGTGERRSAIEGAQAAASPLPGVDALTTGPDGAVYFGDADGVVWKVGADGLLERFAGSVNNECNRGGVDRGCGDTGQARNAALGVIVDLAVGPAGDVYILHEQGGLDLQRERVIRHVAPDGTISALPILWSSPLDDPVSLAVGPDGRLLMSRASKGATPWRFEADGSLTQVLDLQPFLPASPLIASDGEGNLYLAFSSSVYRLSPEGALQAIVPVSLQSTILAGDGGPAEHATLGFVTDIATDAEGSLYLSDLRARRVRKISRPQDCAAFAGPLPTSAPLHAASIAPTVSPGVLFTVFGMRMGPDALLVAGPDEAGSYPTELGGVRVLVDGAPVPLLFVSANQINAALPFGLFESLPPRPISIDTLRPFSLLQIERDGARSAPIAISPYDASPGLFGQGNGLAAALNQDGTLNTFDNPVAPGEVIVLYGSGGGPAEPPATDGQLVSGPLQELTLPVSLTIGGEPAEIIYAGSAPGLIAGVVQVNARISPDQQALGVVQAILTIDGQSSPPTVNVAVGEAH